MNRPVEKEEVVSMGQDAHKKTRMPMENLPGALPGTWFVKMNGHEMFRVDNYHLYLKLDAETRDVPDLGI